MKYTIIDIETTWLSKDRHQITEIAAVNFDWNTITNIFQTLINPKTDIPYFITKLTWISNSMVANAPYLEEIFPNLLTFLGESVFVAHNATFDYWFLSNFGSKNNLNINNPILCTKKLSNRLVLDCKSKSLHSLCQHFHINNKQAHRALSDVLATTELLKLLLNKLNNMWISQIEHIIKLQSISNCKINNFIQKCIS